MFKNQRVSILKPFLASLEACLTLLVVHEAALLPAQRMDERGILSDVRHLLRKSQFLGFVSVNYH